MPGAVRAGVTTIGGRRVVAVDMDASVRRGSLSADASSVLAVAARTALADRVPLVARVASSGADILEGMAALHGWGEAAAALARCSGENQTPAATAAARVTP